MVIDPDELRGLWEREVITYDDGEQDSSKRILWMQARSLYADIRIPRDQRQFPDDLRLDDLDRDDLAELARCGGFGGAIRLQRSTCWWDRDVDWQPDTGVPDVAELSFEGSDLIENGGACGGHQVWRRHTMPRCATLGLRLRDSVDGRSGFLVAAEGRFVHVRGRAAELAPAASLGDVLAGSSDLDAIRDLFDAEVSHGVLDDGGSMMVTTSTLPWQVGRGLGLLAADVATARDLVTTGQDPAGRIRSVRWSITEYEADAGPDGDLKGWARPPSTRTTARR